MSAEKRPAAVEFGARLARWRAQRQWTQAGASARAGVPLATWQRWEQGRRMPGRAQREALEVLMRVTDDVRAASSGR